MDIGCVKEVSRGYNSKVRVMFEPTKKRLACGVEGHYPRINMIDICPLCQNDERRFGNNLPSPLTGLLKTQYIHQKCLSDPPFPHFNAVRRLSSAEALCLVEHIHFVRQKSQSPKTHKVNLAKDGKQHLQDMRYSSQQVSRYFG